MALLTLLNGGDDGFNQFPSASDGLAGIVSGIGSVVDWGLGIQDQILTAQNRSDDASFNRFLQTVQLDTARSVAQAQSDVAKVQAQAALASAQRQLTYQNSPGLSGLVSAVSGSGRYDKLMLILAGVGVVIAIMQMKKG